MQRDNFKPARLVVKSVDLGGAEHLNIKLFRLVIGQPMGAAGFDKAAHGFQVTGFGKVIQRGQGIIDGEDEECRRVAGQPPPAS